MKEQLFDDFESQTAEQWKSRIIAELKGKPFEELMWQTKGLSGKPFYTKEDLPENFHFVNNVPKSPETFGNRHWINYQAIDTANERDANQKALNALNMGADGLLFDLESLPNFEVLLKDIKTQYCAVAFESQTLTCHQIYSAYSSYLKAFNTALDNVTGYISAKAPFFQNEVPGLKTCTLLPQTDLNHYPLQIGFQLAALIDLIDQSDTEPVDCFNSLALQVDLSTDYFSQIALHRALKLALCQLANAYDIKPSEFMTISASSDWSEESTDPHNFILEATTGGMSAIIGGAGALVIRPFYSVFKNNPTLAERTARNISNVLKGEAYLDKNTDPAAGSYYIEKLTSDILNEATSILREIEDKGGLSKIDITSYVKSKIQPE